MQIGFLYRFLFLNEEEIMLPFNICGLAQIEDLVIVFFYGQTSEELKNMPSNNVCAFGKDGKKVWDIEAPFQPKGTPAAYTDIKIDKRGRLIAGTTQGEEYEVDISDGSISVIKKQRPW